MGTTLLINGEEQDHEDSKTVGELKNELGLPASETMTYDDGQATYTLNDGDTVGSIPDGSTFAPLMSPQTQFG